MILCCYANFTNPLVHWYCLIDEKCNNFEILWDQQAANQLARLLTLRLGARMALGKTWNGFEWNGMEWNGLEWNGMEWNGMEWNGMEFNSILS